MSGSGGVTPGLRGRLRGRLRQRLGARLPGRSGLGRRAAAAALDLRGGERVLALAGLDGGGTAVATTEAVAVLDADPAGGAARRWSRDWSAVDRATWDDAARVLRLTWVGGGEDALLLAPGGSLLPEVARERVQGSVVLTRRVDVSGRRGVRLVVRRHRGGSLAVQELPDPGVDLADPRVRDAVARGRAAVSREVGLDDPDPGPRPGGRRPGSDR